MDNPILNEHNKQEHPPMHTAEHLLNGEMARRYGHGRAFSAHIERKKSKLDYHLPEPLTDGEILSLEDYINGIIAEDVEVTEEYITQAEAMDRFDMSRLPGGGLRHSEGSPYRALRPVSLRRNSCGAHGRDRSLPHHQQPMGRGVQRLVFKLG